EEFALETRVIPTTPRASYFGGPPQIDPPVTILECLVEPGHVHIDMVYFLECTAGFPGLCYDAENPIVWVDGAQLELGSLPYRGSDVPLLPDVQALGLDALRAAAQLVPAGVSASSGSTPA